MVLNPWKVQSIDEFNYFCCPECVFRAKEDSSFQAHALQNHVLSKTLFHGTEENDLGQGNLFIIKGYCQLVGCGSICCLGPERHSFSETIFLSLKSLLKASKGLSINGKNPKKYVGTKKT